MCNIHVLTIKIVYGYFKILEYQVHANIQPAPDFLLVVFTYIYLDSKIIL